MYASKISRAIIEGNDVKFHALWLEPAASRHKDGDRLCLMCSSRISHFSP